LDFQPISVDISDPVDFK